MITQTDRGNYRKQETLTHAFTHSCLGRLLMLAVIVGAILVIARLTMPSRQQMIDETLDNVMQCIEANDSIEGDGIDDTILGLGYTFTKADSTKVSMELMQAFHKYNRIEVYDHAFFRTSYIINNMHPEGSRSGIGFMGIVLPTIAYKDMLLRIGPMHKGYDQKIIQQTIIKGSRSFADDPELGL